MSAINVEFFHDAVCGWCFVIAPRLYALKDEFGLNIRHRSFVLQMSRDAMIDRFGSMSQAKDTILLHWEACGAAEDTRRINIEGMRRQTFEYPSGRLSALACQAAQMIDGDEGHGRLFDALQHAHLVDSRNIGDRQTVFDIAMEQGFRAGEFSRHFEIDAPRRLQSDLALGKCLNVRSTPTLVIDRQWVISGAVSPNILRTSLENALSLKKVSDSI